MSATSSPLVTNRLLARLTRRERSQVIEHCELVNLAFGEILCEPGEPFPYIYFPISGFISLMATVSAHPPLEMGLIGFEGMLGVTMVLDINTAPLLGVVQGAGTALRIATPQFRREIRARCGLRQTLNQYLYVLMSQLAHTTACTRFHEIDARLARWLLMTHDRAQGDHFHLTHQILADMLGVQRSAVTIAAGELQRRKLIHYTRGEINILDRETLEAASCECYAAVSEDYAALLG